MNLNIKIDNKLFYIVFVIALLCAISNATSNPVLSKESSQAKTNNVLPFDQSLFIGDAGQMNYKTEADGVIESISNMEAGYVRASNVKENVQDKKYWARKSTDGNGMEAEVKSNYVDFLNSAIDCTNMYYYGIDSEQYIQVHTEMMEKYDMI